MAIFVREALLETAKYVLYFMLNENNAFENIYFKYPLKKRQEDLNFNFSIKINKTFPLQVGGNFQAIL